MTREVYKIVVTHYMEDDEGKKRMMDEPIVCQHICLRDFGNPVMLINDMFNKVRDYVLAKAAQI